MHYALTFFRNSGIGITEINREDILTYLVEKARKYSESTLRSRRF